MDGDSGPSGGTSRGSEGASGGDDSSGWAEVDSFLREAFAGGQIPAFPRTEKTLSCLLRVVRTCRERTQQAIVVSEGQTRAAREYASESESIVHTMLYIAEGCRPYGWHPAACIGRR